MQLETRPEAPYSVNIGFRVIDDQILIDPAEERTWYQHLKTAPNVRVKFDEDEHIYLFKVEPVTDKNILQAFEADRHVLRLSGPLRH